MSDKVAEAIIDFANAMEAAAVNLRRLIGETHGAAVKEEVFLKLLAWEPSKGEKLGDYETTSRKANNNSDTFNHAYNVLKANNAAINNRFHGEGFTYTFWLYVEKPDVIYRQVLKK
jgi:hypothetical protein